MKQLKNILATVALLAVVATPTQAMNQYQVEDTLESVGIQVQFESEYLTRGTFSIFLMEISGNQHLASAAQSPFSDVPSWREDAEAVGVIYQLGLLNGCGDGTFAPDRAITVGEAVTSILRLLDYSATDIGYRWPEDYIIKAQNLGLLDQLPTESAALFTEEMATQLFYNLLLEETRNGQVYGEQLAASVVRDVILISNYGSNGGLVDQLSVLNNGVTTYYEKEKDFPITLLGSGRGTLLLNEAGKAMGFLPNEEVSHQLEVSKVDGLGITDKDGTFYAVPTSATLILGDSKTTFGVSYYSLETYNSALICYGSSGTVELILAQNNYHYKDYMITGFYENASPNPYQPETVTVLGCVFDVDPDISSKFAQFAYGEQFHLILGEDGEVADVIPYSKDLEQPMLGILGKNSVVTLFNGIEVTGDTKNKLFAEEGQLVKVMPYELGKMTVGPARATQYSDLNLDTMKLGKYFLSEDVKIFECVEHSPVTELSLNDIHVDLVDSSQVRYFQLNAQDQVEVLLLNNATGDQYTYGIINTCVVEESSSLGTGNITNEGAYLNTVEGNTEETIVINTFRGTDGQVGGMIWEADGDLVSGIILTATPELPRLAINGSTDMISDGVRIPLAEDVGVYHMRLGRWISLTDALAECSTFVGHYDKTVEEGKIRVIYAYD